MNRWLLAVLVEKLRKKRDIAFGDAVLREVAQLMPGTMET